MAILRYRISALKEPVPGTRIFSMVPDGGPALAFKSGQFVFIHAMDKDGRTVAKKPYSIASAPEDAALEFCITMRNGAMTSLLEKMKVGDRVGIEGPLGHFGYDGQSPAGFVAGGVGIAPFMGMLRHIANKNLRGRFVLFYSAKTREGLLYTDELEALQKKNPDIKIIYTLTRETPDGWTGECGRLGDGMIKKHCEKPDGMIWWVCGPLEMCGAVKTCLVGLGKDPKDIHIEGWG